MGLGPGPPVASGTPTAPGDRSCPLRHVIGPGPPRDTCRSGLPHARLRAGSGAQSFSAMFSMRPGPRR